MVTADIHVTTGWSFSKIYSMEGELKPERTSPSGTRIYKRAIVERVFAEDEAKRDARRGRPVQRRTKP